MTVFLNKFSNIYSKSFAEMQKTETRFGILVSSDTPELS